MTDPRRALPSVNALLELDAVRQLAADAPRALVVDAVRQVLDGVRRDGHAPASPDAWASRIRDMLARATQPSLRPVLNGTGVVLHTNLGRAPLASAAIDAMQRVAAGFSNLEYDLDAGARGSRYAHCAALLRELTGAEDAIVVNNGAAAMLLALNTVADGREAIVSRGELVEIGGSFRVPDVMAKSGARLVEVGTTNRTHLDDYRRALGAETAALVKVHRSNFAVEGFVAEVDVRELAALGASRGVPVLHDLGSGLMMPLDAIGLTGEPTARDAIAAGAALVTMSGDKLLGGPQAGIIVGASALLARIRSNPLTRALRVDKLTLAALEATLALYREPGRALREIPALAMLGAPVDALHERAHAIRRALPADADIAIVESDATVGGGAFPVARIASVALSIGGDAVALEARLRLGDPAVIARVAQQRVIIDVRTILPHQDDALASALNEVLRA
ncbi:MAG TPA: L-seryl-tRNA(Sec) selenium transferase [Gemmatimonadaceae bacterium]|nr:L-seryl-tRNA(Sec) selenium transferase [Gemmatimonadaceae bacterium]